MSNKLFNQQHTIEELISDILSDEAQMINCMRIFFCKTLQELEQEIETERCMFPERKVKLASELISAAAQKETALAEVLEAISKYSEIPPCCIALGPGKSYPLPSEPSIINRVTAEVYTNLGKTSTIAIGRSALFPNYSQGVEETPSLFSYSSYPFPFQASEKSLFNTGNSKIYICNLQTELISEWILLEPGENYPLPPNPPEISRIEFEAKTDAGATSQITLFIEGALGPSDTITDIPKTEFWEIGFIIPVELVELKNTGSSPIYIRNLTTE